MPPVEDRCARLAPATNCPELPDASNVTRRMPQLLKISEI
ncbi:hypothetical protein L915_10741 [Phytophthora nicotianae]|uniref:Uncharacterized protein n=1 Tax=Phytophthora nicotianae TaxID=4792 RepID=W2N8G8_PHYNI|nr:hypothetical protein L915_10741 [Phytophthora nicotianae]ETM44178.1 hypothetical protein L914_10577 [Phytophthora nicotianae]